MKKLHFYNGVLRANRNIFPGLFLSIIVAFTAMAFQDSTQINKYQQARFDTIPNRNKVDIEINLKDLDQTIKKSLEMAENSIKEIDWSKISKQIEQSIQQIDMAKMEPDIKNSMKAIDWQKIKQEIDRSMKEIDLSKMKIDLDKMKTEINLSLKEINTEELEKSMEELKKINFDDVKKEMEKVKIQMELNKDQLKIEMGKVTADMEKVKAEMSEVKEMINEMEKDGLINKQESNIIEYKNKELLINGKKQFPEMTEKYRKYFKGDNFKFKFNRN